MNKLHTALLAIVLCSMVQNLTASELLGLVKSKFTPSVGKSGEFFNPEAKNRFKKAGQLYLSGYSMALCGLNAHNIGNILMLSKKDQSLMHRKWMFMPEKYGKYESGSSRMGNILRGNIVICETLLKSVPRSLLYMLPAVFVWNAYEQSISQE